MEKTGKENAQLELNLATELKENKKHFYKYINSNRMAKENLHPLPDAAGNMTIEDKKKAAKLSMPSLHLSLKSVSLGYSTLTWKSRMESRINSP